MTNARAGFASFVMSALLQTACTRAPVTTPVVVAKPAPIAGTSAACSFPADAKSSVGYAKIRVFVSASGRPRAVEIIAATEPTFAERARRCALTRSYRAARDATGQPVAANTPVITVRFER
jgi:hypothetical protein